MQKKLLTLSLALAVALGGLSSSPVLAAEVDVSDHSSIQAAIDFASPNDTVSVPAGTFTEQLTIDKPLTLRGVQAGIDARSRSGAETIIRSTASPAIQVSSHGVTISGFTIDGVDSPGSTGINVTAGARHDVVVSHNIITNTRNGFYASTGVVLDNFTASYNYFDSNNSRPPEGGNSIFIANLTASNVAITNNNFKDTQGLGSSNAIQVAAVTGGDISGVNISGNSSSNDGSFVFLTSVKDVTIANNTASNLTGHGVLVSDDVRDLTVAGNTFTDSQSGVRLNGTSLQNIEILDNTISGMSLAGVSVGDITTGSSFVVRDNSISGNETGVLNLSEVSVAANNNYWGCEAGPGAVGCDAIEGAVVASEWYVSSDMTETNLDDEAAPGVPNTATASSGINSNVLSPAVAGSVATLVAGFAVIRRYSRT